MQRSQGRGQSHLLRGLPLEGWGLPKLRDEVTGELGGERSMGWGDTLLGIGVCRSQLG